jgi:hypothetical protein
VAWLVPLVIAGLALLCLAAPVYVLLCGRWPGQE